MTGETHHDAQPQAQLAAPPREAVVLCGGGLASTVLIHWLRHHGSVVTVLSCDLGQPATGLLHVADTAAALRCDHRVADLSAVVTTISGPVVRHVEHVGVLAAVSNGMAILLDLGVALAISRSADAVLVGAHGDDTVLRPECDTGYLEALTRQAVRSNLALAAGRFRVQAPFAGLSSGEIVRLGGDLAVSWQRTWSCWYPGRTHCGRCTGCRRRRGAFAAAQHPDPTHYMHGVPEPDAGEPR